LLEHPSTRGTNTTTEFGRIERCHQFGINRLPFPFKALDDFGNP
jgi:hypothetical protein